MITMMYDAASHDRLLRDVPWYGMVWCMRAGLVVNDDGSVSSVVHQFDRFPTLVDLARRLAHSDCSRTHTTEVCKQNKKGLHNHA